MAVKRKFIEIIGNYNPSCTPKQLVINKERALFWMEQGAQPSDTIRNLMCDLGILDKKDKATKVFGKEMTKKAIKEGGEKKPEMAKPSDEGDASNESSSSAEATDYTQETGDENSAVEAPANEAEVEAIDPVAEEAAEEAVEDVVETPEAKTEAEAETPADETETAK